MLISSLLLAIFRLTDAGLFSNIVEDSWHMKKALFAIVFLLNGAVYGQSSTLTLEGDDTAQATTRVISEHMFLSEVEGVKVLTVFKTENGKQTSTIFKGEVAEQKLRELELKKAARSAKGY